MRSSVELRWNFVSRPSVQYDQLNHQENWPAATDDGDPKPIDLSETTRTSVHDLAEGNCCTYAKGYHDVVGDEGRKWISQVGVGTSGQQHAASDHEGEFDGIAHGSVVLVQTIDLAFAEAEQHDADDTDKYQDFVHCFLLSTKKSDGGTT